MILICSECGGECSPVPQDSGNPWDRRMYLESDCCEAPVQREDGSDYTYRQYIDDLEELRADRAYDDRDDDFLDNDLSSFNDLAEREADW